MSFDRAISSEESIMDHRNGRRIEALKQMQYNEVQKLGDLP